MLAEFVEFGAETAEVMMDKVTGRSRGFGFVMFTSKEGMDDAIAKRHNTEIDGRKISVRSAIPQDQIPPGGWGGQATLGRQVTHSLLLLITAYPQPQLDRPVQGGLGHCLPCGWSGALSNRCLYQDTIQ
jgi:RNA recognition motif-containing protein